MNTTTRHFSAEDEHVQIQSAETLDNWYRIDDPWNYESHPDDALRKNTLLAELPSRQYQRVLDIGCGQGFITRDLPGIEVIGVDISAKAIAQAQRHASPRLHFVQGAIFDLSSKVQGPFDLILVTGVLYPQYIGHALTTVYRDLTALLGEDGLLMSVHIDDWCQARFPMLRIREHFYPYREYLHRLELYIK